MSGSWKTYRLGGAPESVSHRIGYTKRRIKAAVAVAAWLSSSCWRRQRMRDPKMLGGSNAMPREIHDAEEKGIWSVREV